MSEFALSQPQVKCACPSIDPWWCIGLRYGIDREQAEEGEPCECCCHDDFFDDLYEEEFDEPELIW